MPPWSRSSSTSAAHSVTSTSSRIVITDIPRSCKLGLLTGEVSSIASSAATLTVHLNADSGGDIPFTDAVAQTIVVGETTATDGGVGINIGVDYLTQPNGTAGSIWLSAKTDTGTCTVTWTINWLEER